MDKNTPKPKRSPKRKNRKFHQKNRYANTQKHNLTNESNQKTPHAVNNINKVKLFTTVAIQKRKKHKIKKNYYNNI